MYKSDICGGSATSSTDASGFPSISSLTFQLLHISLCQLSSILTPMFNAPRRTNVTSLASSAIFSSSNSGGSGGFDPLAQSTPNLGSNAFGDVDPWSTAPSPVRASTPRRESSEPESLPVTNGTPVIGGVTAEEGLNQFISTCLSRDFTDVNFR